MVSPDFVSLAKSYSLKAKKIEAREELENALVEMLDHKGSYLLEIMVAKEENVFPMMTTGASVSEIRLN